MSPPSSLSDDEAINTFGGGHLGPRRVSEDQAKGLLRVKEAKGIRRTRERYRLKQREVTVNTRIKYSHDYQAVREEKSKQEYNDKVINYIQVWRYKERSVYRVTK